MIGLDTNIIIHLLVKSQVEHQKVAKWFSTVQHPLATTQTNLGEILRLLTHPKVFPSPLSLKNAIGLLQDFIEQFNVLLLEESENWWIDLKELALQIPGISGNEVFDARIALCLRYNRVREICTLDSDFSKYPFLKVVTI